MVSNGWTDFCPSAIVVMIYTLGHLYEQGKISSGLGARVLDCDRWGFCHLLAENGFSVIDYPLDDQDDEARTSREIADWIRSR